MKKAVILLILLFGVLSCETTEPQVAGETQLQLQLHVVDVSCTETWLEVKLPAGIQPRTFSLRRDTNIVVSATLAGTETLIVDEGLNPNRPYGYRAFRQITPAIAEQTSLVQVSTLDTTSHNWTFVVDTIGGTGSSLRDVAIVSENNVWAVGEINPGSNALNVARWNGQQWELLGIQFLDFCDQASTFSYAARSVFAFGPQDIWISSGSQVVRWNGTTQSTPVCIPVSVNKMWGPHPNSLYAVGINGQIAHFNGSTWTQMPSPTDVDLLDVWGSPDGSVVWACGWEDFKPTVLLRYSGNTWEKIYEDTDHRFTIRSDSLSGHLTSIASWNNRAFLLLSSAGLYRAPMSTRGEAKRYSFTPGFFPGFPRKLRGNNFNDLFLVGEYYMIAHFNGITFKYFSDIYGIGRLWSVDQKGNTVFAVGVIIDAIDRKGIVFRGVR